MELEKLRKYKREYMREYNKTEKGKAYNRRHVKDWRKKQTEYKPHGNRPSIASGYRKIIVAFLIDRDGFNCGFCQQTLEGREIHIDHIIPVMQGGEEIMSNVRLAHSECNLAQGLLVRQQLHGY